MTTTEIFSTVMILVNTESRKPAFGNFRRDVSFKTVEELTEKMKINGFRKAEIIGVFKAEEAVNHGVPAMFDINGQTIPAEELKNYWLTVEGNHRTYAAANYNKWLIEQGNPEISIPGTEIELLNGETIPEYLYDVNSTKKGWLKEDYAKNAAMRHPEIPLLQKYNELVKTPGNTNGIPLSTLNLIFCLTRGLHKPDFLLLCSGASKKKIKKEFDNIIPAHNIERGCKFLEICKAVGFDNQEIGKRFLIAQFNSLLVSDSPEFGFKVFESISKDDITAMSNSRKHLDGQKVIDHFQVIIQRVRNSNPQPEQEPI